MLNIIIIVLVVILLYFMIRFFLLRESIRNTKEQLDEIVSEIDENRIIHLSHPDSVLEELQRSINMSLDEVRLGRVSYAKKEKEFKQQIESISHDLRTPLTSIQGYLRIIDSKSLSKEDKENLKIIQRKADTLQNLITQFYDFSRLTAEDYSLHPIRLDLTRLLRETMTDSYMELSARAIEVQITLPDTPIWVKCDRDAMERVFLNLIQNAGKYAKSQLLIQMEEKGNYVEICFKNDVEGLDERDVEKIFERFYTNDKSRGNGSTGLGLTIARELVRKMHGQLDASLEYPNCLQLTIRYETIY